MELQEHLPGATAVSGSAAKRPMAVTFVGLLALVAGAYHVVDGVLVLVNGGDASKLAEGAFELALGVFAICIGTRRVADAPVGLGRLHDAGRSSA